ncbi:MAG: thioredoxin family protein [Planctomycetaceae bacterium]
MRVAVQIIRIAIVSILLGAVPIGGSTASCEAQTTSTIGPITVQGRVVDADSNGVPNAQISVQYRRNFVTAVADTTADASGHFSVHVDSQAIVFRQWKIVARTKDAKQVGYYRHVGPDPTDREVPIEIRVEPTKPLTVQVVDSDSKPVADANVVVQFGYPHTTDRLTTDSKGKLTLLAPESERVDAIMAWKDRVGFDYQVYALGRNQQADLKTPVPEFPSDGETLRLEGASPVRVKVVDGSGKPIAGVRLYPWLLRKESANQELNVSFVAESVVQTTGESGTTTFQWMPQWQTSVVTIWPTVDGYARSRANYDPATDHGESTVVLERLVAIQGRVLDDVGDPVEGISVNAYGEGYGWDSGRGQAKSASDGAYELLVPPEQIYMVTVDDEVWVSDAIPSFPVNSGKPVKNIDLRLRQPTRLTGQLRSEPSGKPIANDRVLVYQYGDDLGSIEGASIANPENSRKHVQPIKVLSTPTDSDGRFEFLLGNGSYDIRPPRQEKTEKFVVSGEDALSIDVTTAIQAKSKLLGTVKRRDGDRSLSDVRVEGVSQRFTGDDWQALTDKDGAFAVERLSEPTYVSALNADKSLGAVVVLAADQTAVELVLEKTGSADGVLLQTDSEAPAPNTKISFGIRVPDERQQSWSKRFGGSVVTDSEGRFELDGLVAGWKYELDLEPRADGTIPNLDGVTVDPGQKVDLGSMHIPAPRKPYVPPTLTERIAAAMNVAGSPLMRLERAISRCKLNNQKLLIVLGDPDDPRLRRFMEWRYGDEDFAKVRDDFRIMALSTKSAAEESGVKELLDKWNADAGEDALKFSLVLVDQDGDLVAHRAAGDLTEEDELSKDAVIQWLSSHREKPIDARKLFEDALARAKKENKRVLIQETATWCGPCHLLSDYLHAHRDWETDYIWIKMDHRFTGAREIMAEVRNGAEGGIPWFAILDASGNKLATSNHFESGNNIGFPSSKEGLAHLRKMLIDTRLSMTDEKIDEFVAGLSSDK